MLPVIWLYAGCRLVLLEYNRCIHINEAITLTVRQNGKSWYRDPLKRQEEYGWDHSSTIFWKPEKMKNDMEKRNRTSWGERRNELFSRLGGETFTNNEVVLAHVFAFVFLLTALLAGAFE